MPRMNEGAVVLRGLLVSKVSQAIIYVLARHARDVIVLPVPVADDAREGRNSAVEVGLLLQSEKRALAALDEAIFEAMSR